MSTAEPTQTPFRDETAELTDTERIANALGGRTRIELLYYLADADEPVRQFEIADALEVTPPTITRSKQFLLREEFVIDGNDGLYVPEEVEAVLADLRGLLIDPETDYSSE